MEKSLPIQNITQRLRLEMGNLREKQYYAPVFKKREIYIDATRSKFGWEMGRCPRSFNHSDKKFLGNCDLEYIRCYRFLRVSTLPLKQKVSSYPKKLSENLIEKEKQGSEKSDKIERAG